MSYDLQQLDASVFGFLFVLTHSPYKLEKTFGLFGLDSIYLAHLSGDTYFLVPLNGLPNSFHVYYILLLFFVWDTSAFWISPLQSSQVPMSSDICPSSFQHTLNVEPRASLGVYAPPLSHMLCTLNPNPYSPGWQIEQAPLLQMSLWD